MESDLCNFSDEQVSIRKLLTGIGEEFKEKWAGNNTNIINYNAPVDAKGAVFGNTKHFENKH